MARNLFGLRNGAMAAVAASLFLSAPAFAVSDQTVTIESNKHSSKAPVIRQLPPSTIPQLKAPDNDGVPVAADTSAAINPRLGGNVVGDGGVQQDWSRPRVVRSRANASAHAANGSSGG